MFGRKKPQLPPPPAPERVPTDRVMQLSQRGYSDPEIIRTLREEGFKPTEVDKALKQALKSTAFGGPAQLPAARRPSLSDELDEEGPPRSDLALPELPWQQKQRTIPPAPPSFEPMRPAEAAPPQPAPVEPAPQWAPPPSPLARPLPPRPPARRPPPLDDDIDEVPSLPGRRPPPPTAKRDAVAEVVESVIEEKWDAMQGELESLEHRIKALEDHVQIASPAASADTHALQQSLDAAHQQTQELSAKMDAMERVVKDSLTPMMETMRSLTDALREMKQARA